MLNFVTWLPGWDSNPDNPVRGNNAFRERRSIIKLPGNIFAVINFI